MEVVPGLHWVDPIWDTKVYVLLEPDKVVLIDAATPGRARTVWRFLADLGYPPESVDEIWLTHGDLDHIGSVAALKAGSGAKVVAHGADVGLVEGRAERELGPVRWASVYRPVVGWFGRHVIHYQPTDVDSPVQDGDALGEWRVVHVPGHTAGSVCYYHAERRIAIVGDALNRRRGRLGAPPALFTSNMDQAHASIKRIAALDMQVCCFGHGPPLVGNARLEIRAFADSLRPD